MLKILALVDGSKSSSRAVRYVIEMSAACKDTPDVHLLNVQLPVAPGIAARHVRRRDLDAYYRDEGMAALAPARRAFSTSRRARAIRKRSSSRCPICSPPRWRPACRSAGVT
jgi:hypothetical protein